MNEYVIGFTVGVWLWVAFVMYLLMMDFNR